MTKSLNEFGGWLKFFYITLWLRLIFSLVLGLILILERMGVGRTTTPSAIIWVSAVYFLINSVVVINILKIVKKADPHVPDKMLCLIYIYVCLLLIYFGADWLVKNSAHYPITYNNWGPDVVWATSFMQYVINSKRVKVYYGGNAVGNIRDRVGDTLINLLPNCWSNNK